MFVLVAAPQAGPAKVCTSQHCEIPIGNRRNAPANRVVQAVLARWGRPESDLERGAKVRLIGDDQQLAAIGAGGVLRDIEASQGALRLNELMRFRTPGEGSASLAMRDGRPEAIGFYLDHQRVHVGDLSTMTDEVFDSWRADRGDGRDSIMLAPTRDLVAQLNSRARAHRLEGADAGPSVRLCDGLEASVGDQVITRTNDRRLRVSPTDWVKNGDRFTVRMRKFGVPYRMTNTVTEAEPSRVIEWRHPGGHRWRWEFRDNGDGTTEITEIFDYSWTRPAVGKALETLRLTKDNARGIQASLTRLAARHL